MLERLMYLSDIINEGRARLVQIQIYRHKVRGDLDLVGVLAEAKNRMLTTFCRVRTYDKNCQEYQDGDHLRGSDGKNLCSDNIRMRPSRLQTLKEQESADWRKKEDEEQRGKICSRRRVKRRLP
ncbi:hypothetical protein QAD02_009077 [Eretmocerus hayati]|uniref:Uncharacterized protein n=1 Tax=Eretmocerus hayati TaxID=131215 RepID=A0ACC2NAQ2_9HYME|nr:hypothetical protein QAD02_009077 [Eretmocerus hayati]